MKKNLTFINPRTYSHTEVRVGIDHLQLLAGVVAVFVKLYGVMSSEPLSQVWVLGFIVMAHLRLGRHAMTLPVLGSMVLALMSFGMSLVISSTLINKLVAQHYRDAGWKIRNQDGGIGEYSSRFLALHELGFNDSDMTQTSALHLR
jgi:cytosine/uracil/thiamine/allantoin permease